jgi:hypothetical protein
MILVDDNLRFISLIRSDNDSAKFCDSAETDFNDKFSPEDDTANLTVI